jgi:hypothetical protein
MHQSPCNICSNLSTIKTQGIYARPSKEQLGTSTTGYSVKRKDRCTAWRVRIVFKFIRLWRWRKLWSKNLRNQVGQNVSRTNSQLIKLWNAALIRRVKQQLSRNRNFYDLFRTSCDILTLPHSKLPNTNSKNLPSKPKRNQNPNLRKYSSKKSIRSKNNENPTVSILQYFFLNFYFTYYFI